MIELYTASYCGYCEKAISLLFKGGYSFRVIDVTQDEIKRYALRSKTGCKTIPQVFVNGEFVGGCSDLQILLENRGLDEMLSDVHGE